MYWALQCTLDRIVFYLALKSDLCFHWRVAAYPDRTYPHGSLRYAALSQDFWSAHLDISQRVAVYWRGDAGDEPTVVGYYDTVSEAVTARDAAVKPNGSIPSLAINWFHPDTAHLAIGGPEVHADAREDWPSWIDVLP